MTVNKLGVFIDGENVNQFEIISEIYKNLDLKTFIQKLEKLFLVILIMSTLVY